MLKNILIVSTIGVTPIFSQFSNNINYTKNSNPIKTLTDDYNEYHINNKYKGGDNNDYRVAFDWTKYASNWDDFASKYQEIGLFDLSSCMVYVNNSFHKTTDKTIKTSDINRMNWDDIYAKPNATFSASFKDDDSSSQQEASTSLWFTYDSEYVYYLSSWSENNTTDNMIGTFDSSDYVYLYQ